MSIKIQQLKTPKEPKLRFPGFSGAWEEKKLGGVAEIKRGAASQYLKYQNDLHNRVRLLRINDFSNDDAVFVEDTEDMKKFRVKSGDLLIAGTGATAGIIFMVPEKFDGMAFSYNVPRIRISNANRNFLYSYLKSDLIIKQQKRLFVGNAQHFLDTDVIRGLKINIPDFPEQQKIAGFLGSVDEWLENLRLQKESLKSYKEGMMQKIFAQDIRFKDDNGKDFPEWEEERLGEIAEITTNSYYEVDSNCKNGYYLADMGSISPEGKLLMRKQTTNINGLLDKGNLVMPNRDIGHGDIIGKVALIDEDNKYVLGSNMYKLEVKNHLPIFVYYIINSPFVNREMRRRSNGTSQLQLIRKDVDTVKVIIPIIEEQQKISEFLTSLDNLIESKQQQITQLEQWKNGLMQGLFV